MKIKDNKLVFEEGICEYSLNIKDNTITVSDEDAISIFSTAVNKYKLLSIYVDCGARYYKYNNDVMIPLGDLNKARIAQDFIKLVLEPMINQTSNTHKFDSLARLNIFVGKPDCGKTYDMLEIAKELPKDRSAILACDDNTSLFTVTTTFGSKNGVNMYLNTEAFYLMFESEEKALVGFDEGNLITPRNQKGLQSLFDETNTHLMLMREDPNTGEVTYKTCKINPNCKFIMTMNDKDKGINILADAILSRAKIKYYDPVSSDTLAKWTGHNKNYIEAVQKMFTLYGLDHIFGSRQLKAINNMNVNELRSHLKGLVALQGRNFTMFNGQESVAVINDVIKLRG